MPQPQRTEPATLESSYPFGSTFLYQYSIQQAQGFLHGEFCVSTHQIHERSKGRVCPNFLIFRIQIPNPSPIPTVNEDHTILTLPAFYKFVCSTDFTESCMGCHFPQNSTTIVCLGFLINSSSMVDSIDVKVTDLPL